MKGEKIIETLSYKMTSHLQLKMQLNNEPNHFQGSTDCRQQPGRGPVGRLQRFQQRNLVQTHCRSVDHRTGSNLHVFQVSWFEINPFDMFDTQTYYFYR